MDEPAHTYFVPVHPARDTGMLVVQTGRLPEGQKVGIAFSELAALTAAMGTSQRWISLSDPALRTMLAPLGIRGIQLDPVFVGPDVRPARPEPARPAVLV